MKLITYAEIVAACDKAGLRIEKTENNPKNIGIRPALALAVALNEGRELFDPATSRGSRIVMSA